MMNDDRLLIKPGEAPKDRYKIDTSDGAQRAIEEEDGISFLDMPSEEELSLDGVRLIEPLLYRHPILSQICKPCEFPLGDDVMMTTMRIWKCLRHYQKNWKSGVVYYLTAPQIGVPIRVFSIRVWKKHFMTLANPEIMESAGVNGSVEEGCLSLVLDKKVKGGTRTSHFSTKINRAAGIKFRGIDVRSQEQISGWLWDLEAIWFQHALDHLDGKMIVDQATRTERTFNRELLRRLDRERRKRKL